MNLTEEELQELKQLQLKSAQAVYILGKVSLSTIELKNDLKVLEKEQDDAYLTYTNVCDEEDVIFKKLKDKYGEGTINLDTGEVTNS